MTAMTRFFRRLRFRQAAIAVAFVCAAGALSACGGGGGGGSGGGDAPSPPNIGPSPALPFITPAIVGRDGLPVQGLHYVRVGDRNMVQSEATDENGLFNPRFAPGRAADEVLFGVGSFPSQPRPTAIWIMKTRCSRMRMDSLLRLIAPAAIGAGFESISAATATTAACPKIRANAIWRAFSHRLRLRRPRPP